MKKLKQIALLFLGIALVTISSCKKYPDGPLLSIHSKENRVVGTWVVDYYSINGYDSTSYLQAQPYYGKYIFEKQKGDYSALFTILSNNNIYVSSGSWRFANRKKDLNIDQFFASQYYTNPYIATVVTWEIRRLTDADLWLKTNYNSKEYFMKLKH